MYCFDQLHLFDRVEQDLPRADTDYAVVSGAFCAENPALSLNDASTPQRMDRVYLCKGVTTSDEEPQPTYHLYISRLERKFNYVVELGSTQNSLLADMLAHYFSGLR